MDQLLVSVYVISINEEFDMYIPINMKVTDLINFIKEKIVEETAGAYEPKEALKLYDVTTTKLINSNNIVKYSGIKFGSKLLLK
jgi:hypothetical protein